MSANGTEPKPRLCHVVKVDNFSGYGFDLQAEPGKKGQFIGNVDPGSPAETAGLRKGDKILEVNGSSIAEDNHRQVVQKIKAVSNETKLLVQSAEVIETTTTTTPESPKKNGAAPEIQKPKEESHEIFAPKENNKLNLGMTAAEMRAQLAAKKKVDPKKIPLDARSKFEIVKQL